MKGAISVYTYTILSQVSVECRNDLFEIQGKKLFIIGKDVLLALLGIKEGEKYSIFLDDLYYPFGDTKYSIDDEWFIRNCRSELTVRTLVDFKFVIQELGLPESISFDYDLSHTNHHTVTGLTCLDWLVDYMEEKMTKPPFHRKYPMLYCHSKHPRASELIKRINMLNKISGNIE